MRSVWLLLLIMPIVEMWVLISVGAHIGAFVTILLVVLTAVFGVSLLRQQGLQTLWQAKQKMLHGQLPAREMFSGVILAVSGAFLVTPGFVTDAFGFAVLIPSIREVLAVTLMRKIFARTTLFSNQVAANEPSAATTDSGARVIDGECSEYRDPRL